MQLSELFLAENLILKLFNQPIHPAINSFAIFLNYSVYIFLAALLIYHYGQRVGMLFWKRRRGEFIQLIFNLVVGFAAVYFLKYAIGRPRPPVELFRPVIQKLDPSFPSSHTFIAFLCLRFLPREFPHWLKLVLIVYLVAAIPISILYLGIHYPSDLLAGALLGLVLPFIFTKKISQLVIEKVYRIRRLLPL